MVDDVDYIIQERNIVGNKDKGIFIILQVALEPIDVLRIQVVSWLILVARYQVFLARVWPRGPWSAAHLKGRYIRLHAKVHDSKSTRHFINLGIQGIEIPTL